MLRFPCLVLDHDDTVVQSEKTLGFPCFVQTMAQLRPNISLTLEEYVQDCHSMGFYNLCREKYNFTQAEMDLEYDHWTQYIRNHIPAPFPGIDRIIHKQKALGGIICVVSHNSKEIILRDYRTHFGITPDAIFGCDLPEQQQKPNLFPLQSIMAKYSLSPADLLVLDDSRIGYDMAGKLGVPTAFAAWGKEGYKEVIDEMTALCDYTFFNPSDFDNFLFA